MAGFSVQRLGQCWPGAGVTMLLYARRAGARASPARTGLQAHSAGGGPSLAGSHAAAAALPAATRDQACRIFYEPRVGQTGRQILVPVLAAELPSRDNGGLSADGRSVTREASRRAGPPNDGIAFTADDCVFTQNS